MSVGAWILTTLTLGPFVFLAIRHILIVHVWWPRYEREWEAEQERKRQRGEPRNSGRPTIYR